MGTFAESAVVDCRLSFADQGKQTFVSPLQQTNRSWRCHFPLLSCSVYVYIGCRSKRKTEAQVIFLNPFTVYTSYKQKFVVCMFVDKETKRNYEFK
jgi:hypothetical protein